MIEFHEDEYFHSPLEDRTLRAILNFVPDLIPREVYDQLLFKNISNVPVSVEKITEVEVVIELQEV